MAVSRQDLRQDASKYVEGVEKGNAINLKLYKNSILAPNITFTPATLNDAGTLEIPRVSTTTEQTATNICEKANYSVQDVELVTVSIDKKVSEEYGGCFVSAGLADKEFKEAIDKQKTNTMQKAFERHFNTLITDGANSTAGTVVDQPKAWDKLLAERTAFFKRTGEMPTAVYVSAEFEAKIISEKILRETNEGDLALTRGVVGEVLGMNIIRNDFLTKDFVMLNAMAVYVVSPQKTSQVAVANGQISGNGPLSIWSNGVSIIEGADRDTGIVKTSAHKYFGMKVIDPKYITVSEDDTKKVVMADEVPADEVVITDKVKKTSNKKGKK